MVLDGFGWFWVVLGGFGWFRVLVTTTLKSIRANIRTSCRMEYRNRVLAFGLKACRNA